ncbi:hypothetical protein PbB2_02943 [Candidatus Phycosocius bacilliformis]|uniref:Uncharacterized protein n=1 Tax=Candidatus Phycosocius bacilliformis TaxID=1445552 RepID=A0A2P2EDY5_9PROT|nr:DUF6615 family protein [Candidatus Phycosocius bacilliformis]GBF59251.1 hypothetical protein PbB2_02943 [Candidatus Phycosocius bacilliformis]
MSPLRDAFRKEAGRIWRDKAKAESLGLQLNEETITETILFHLAKQFQGGDLSVTPFTKPQEKANGADWEMWFMDGSKAVGLRVQAKRLFAKNGYASLTPNGPQTKTLISQSSDCYPVFVLYNDRATYKLKRPVCGCKSYRGLSYLGCTLASAYSVKHLKECNPTTLNPICIPWHCILCPVRSKPSPSLPEVVAGSINARAIGDGKLADPAEQRCNVISTPNLFRAHLENVANTDRSVYSAVSAMDEHNARLERYLEERELTGALLISRKGRD